MKGFGVVGVGLVDDHEHGAKLLKLVKNACALDRDGNKVFDKPLPQLESELAGVFHQLQKLGPGWGRSG